MNLTVLKTFCDLVDSGSFSRAAESNYVSQSAVSQQLSKLESTLSVQLISRGGGIVVPTEAGKAFYRGAKEICRRYEQLVGEVRSVSDSVRGTLRVGTIYSVGFYFLDPYVREFFQKHPEANLHVSYTSWNQIYASVIDGEMDMGIVACPDANRSLDIIPLEEEQLVVVCPPNDPLAHRESVVAADLEGRKFAAFSGNIPTRRHIDKLLKAAKVHVNITLEFDNIELLKRVIMIGSAVSILPEESVISETQRGDLVFVPFRYPKRWTRPVGIVRRKDRQPTPAEVQFLTILAPKTKKKFFNVEG